MGYMVEVTLEDFDDWSILEAAEEIIEGFNYKEGSKEEELLRKMYKHLCKMFDEDSQINSESFVDPSTASDIYNETQFKNHIEQSNDFKFFSDI